MVEKYLTDKEMDDTAEVIVRLMKRVAFAERERDALAAKVRDYEERLKGRVVVPVNVAPALIPGRAWFDINYYSVIGTFATEEEGCAALQTVIDEKEANHGNDHG
jgi:hypothetical protein